MKTDIKNRVTSAIINNKALIILVVLCIVSNILTHGKTFMYLNVSSVSRQIAVTCLIGIGFTVLLSSGGVDLSAGNLVSLCGVVYAILTLAMPLPFAIIGAILFGAFCGYLNGALSVYMKLQPFIVTLAMAQVFKGFAYLLSNGKSITGLSASVKYIGQGMIFGKVPFSITIAVAVCIIVAILMYRTSYGRHTIATGGNEEAAKVSGINTKMIKIMAFVVTGITCSIASIVLTGRVSIAAPGAGEGMEMDAIAAVVIGGTPMSGGKAKVVSTIFGCLVIGMMNNLLNLMNVSSFWQWVAKGSIIILAIVLDSWTNRLLEKKN